MPSEVKAFLKQFMLWEQMVMGKLVCKISDGFALHVFTLPLIKTVESTYWYILAFRYQHWKL
jgi:hypothetical protein